MSPTDRPDLSCRIFKLKLDHLIKEIKKGVIFDEVKAMIYTIEFQKRGLPHAHILVFLKSIIDQEGFPVYRRRDNGVSVKKGESFADNRFVVPCNKVLLLK